MINLRGLPMATATSRRTRMGPPYRTAQQPMQPMARPGAPSVEPRQLQMALQRLRALAPSHPQVQP